MTQSIKAEVTIAIPDDKVLVEEAYIEELEEQVQLKKLNWYWNDVKELTGLSDYKLRLILRYPKFRRILNSENGGCVYYPPQGGSFSFEPERFRKFYKDYFDEIHKLFKNNPAK